ncbi:MAG: pimB1 [Gemmatimonadetes bacterium]|nr:pimB1 [Gemmatimonadota bacterium]
MTAPLRLLTIAHSYSVSRNRRLADELGRAGGTRWHVTSVAPTRFPGDFGEIVTTPVAGENARLERVRMHFAQSPHLSAYAWRLKSLLQDRWDFVHCWEEPYVLVGAQVACWTPRSASLVYATFQNIPKRYPPPFNWLERYSMRRASGWIAFGRTVEDALRDRPGYAERPHAMIPTGVDVDAFRPDPEAGRAVRQGLGWADDGVPVIGFLGRFIPEKGLGLLMRVLERLDTPWRALFVGDGPMAGELRGWRTPFADRVRVVTGVSHDDVPRYLNAMDMLCAPSETTPRWREQLGRMLIEAFACGVPVLGSSSGEIPHVVSEAGLVLPEGDVEAWYAAIRDLLVEPERRAALAARGRARAEAEYAWPVLARRTLDFLESTRRA